MCAYKLCRVEFKYWGMQTKLEKFIHDTALRKTMLRAHRQAWAWQDEWHGLTMDDIREIEKATQLALQRTMGNESTEDDCDDELSDEGSKQSNKHISSNDDTDDIPKIKQIIPNMINDESTTEGEESNEEFNEDERKDRIVRPTIHSPGGSSHSFDLQVSIEFCIYFGMNGSSAYL